MINTNRPKHFPHFHRKIIIEGTTYRINNPSLFPCPKDNGYQHRAVDSIKDEMKAPEKQDTAKNSTQ